jgi:hypothetical protein
MSDSAAMMLLGNATGPERAQRLLTLPDAVILREHEALAAACRDEREAVDYISAKVAALSSRRDETGALMPGHSITLVHARLALRRLAGC